MEVTRCNPGNLAAMSTERRITDESGDYCDSGSLLCVTNIWLGAAGVAGAVWANFPLSLFVSASIWSTHGQSLYLASRKPQEERG